MPTGVGGGGLALRYGCGARLDAEVGARVPELRLDLRQLSLLVGSLGSGPWLGVFVVPSVLPVALWGLVLGRCCGGCGPACVGGTGRGGRGGLHPSAMVPAREARCGPKYLSCCR